MHIYLALSSSRDRLGKVGCLIHDIMSWELQNICCSAGGYRRGVEIAHGNNRCLHSQTSGASQPSPNMLMDNILAVICNLPVTQVDKAVEYLEKAVALDERDEVLYEISVRRNDSSAGGRGIYLREPLDSRRAITCTVEVKPTVHEVCALASCLQRFSFHTLLSRVLCMAAYTTGFGVGK
jgi:hypothetical protein